MSELFLMMPLPTIISSCYPEVTNYNSLIQAGYLTELHVSTCVGNLCNDLNG